MVNTIGNHCLLINILVWYHVGEGWPLLINRELQKANDNKGHLLNLKPNLLFTALSSIAFLLLFMQHYSHSLKLIANFNGS